MSEKDDRMDELEQQITELRRAHRDTAIDRPRPGENQYQRVDDGEDGETDPDPARYKIAYDDGDLPAGEVGDDLPKKTDDDGEPTDEIDYEQIGMTGPGHSTDDDADGEDGVDKP